MVTQEHRLYTVPARHGPALPCTTSVRRPARSRPSYRLDGAFDAQHRKVPHILSRDPGALHFQTHWRDCTTAVMVKCLLRSLLLYCSALLLPAPLRATYHLGAGDPQLIAAQSYAQTRNNGRPPIRTLNPASKFQKEVCLLIWSRLSDRLEETNDVFF